MFYNMFLCFYVGIRVLVKAVIALAQAKKIKHPVQFPAGWLVGWQQCFCSE